MGGLYAGRGAGRSNMYSQLMAQQSYGIPGYGAFPPGVCVCVRMYVCVCARVCLCEWVWVWVHWGLRHKLIDQWFFACILDQEVWHRPLSSKVC
jgi:hypothetical protein